MKKFPFYMQLDTFDCGPTCLKMIAQHYGKVYSLDFLRQRSYITRVGVSLLSISEAAEAIGFRATGVKLDYASLAEDAPLPCIVHWKQRHFVVVYAIKKDVAYVADPGFGLVQYTTEEFIRGWAGESELGTALFLATTPRFFELEDEEQNRRIGFAFLAKYIRPYSRLFFQMFLGMAASSIFLLITPFLTQSLVDYGINRHDLSFVFAIFVANMMIFLGDSMIGILRSWILLHIGTRVNISLISDFLMKLLRLPMSFFNSKMMGDILQRIDDHGRFEQLLTATSLNVLFSLLNLAVFSVVLLLYSFSIFAIFLAGSAVSILWTIIFLKKRKVLDFKRFSQLSSNRGRLIHFIAGIQEIKVSNCDMQKRWEWEDIQAKLFKINIKSLSLSQFQNTGSALITQLKNIVISIISAKAVIDGDVTLGGMMAITYITGQLNNPIQQLMSFILTLQDAKIGLERINEVHEKDEEEPPGRSCIHDIAPDRDITLRDVSFSYGSTKVAPVLHDLNLTIPAGKVTAIVGVSGSGKTTLMKLLLKFYPASSGQITLGGTDFNELHSGKWREHCGAVMQNGYIFSDTIAHNIALGDLTVDYARVEKALKTANAWDFVMEQLPLKHQTKIGEEGLTLSQGQTQRILLARAIYKQPQLLFLDEATNALDAQNEKEIIDHLQEFFTGRTVVVIAHRLSTVKNADKIVVLDRGQIVEEGTHAELAKRQGFYFNLVRNQLELGK